MSMIQTSTHFLKCDYPKCEQTFEEFSQDLPARQWAEARSKGWASRNTGKKRDHYCPVHANKLRLPFGAPNPYRLVKPAAESPAEPVRLETIDETCGQPEGSFKKFVAEREAAGIDD